MKKHPEGPGCFFCKFQEYFPDTKDAKLITSRTAKITDSNIPKIAKPLAQ